MLLNLDGLHKPPTTHSCRSVYCTERIIGSMYYTQSHTHIYTYIKSQIIYNLKGSRNEDKSCESSKQEYQLWCLLTLIGLNNYLVHSIILRLNSSVVRCVAMVIVAQFIECINT